MVCEYFTGIDRPQAPVAVTEFGNDGRVQLF